MLLKPHNVVLLPPVQRRESASETLDAPTFTPGVSVACQITPMKANAAFAATGVEITSPYLLLAEVTDAGSFVIGTRLQWLGKTFRVAGPAQLWQLGTPNDCCEVVLSEMTDLE